MASVEEVLSTMTAADVLGAETSVEYVIDNELRIITVPRNGVVLGVEGDKDVNTIHFKMPRMYRGLDLGDGFNIRVNYANAKAELGYFAVVRPDVTEDSISFEWLLGSHALMYVGEIKFAVSLIKSSVDGRIEKKFNTTLGKAQCLTGLDVDVSVPEEDIYDLLTQIKQDVMTDIQPSLDGAKADAAAAKQSATQAAESAATASTGAENVRLGVEAVKDAVKIAEQTSAHVDEVKTAVEASSAAASGDAAKAEAAKTAAVTAQGKAEEAKTSAEQFKMAAEQAKNDASASKTSSEESAKQAKASQDSASTSAQTASAKAGEASVSAQTAKGHSDAASAKAEEAKTSADAAKVSETNTKAAENAAVAAQGKAEEAKTFAEQFKTAAEQAKNDATAQAQAAAQSAEAAEQAKTEASTSKTAAAQSAEAAEQAKTEASTSKTAAAESAKQAKASQDAASISAQTASTKAEEAKTSADAAKVSETNAKAAENAATSIVENAKIVSDNVLKGEETATLINVTDAWPSKPRSMKIYGQSNQVTTTGKNLMRLINGGTANGVNLTANGDGSYHVKGAQTAGFTRFYSDDGIKKPLAEFGLKVGDTVYLSASEANSKLYAALFFFDEKSSQVYTQVVTSANVTKYTIAENITQAYVCISLDGSVGTSVNSDFHPMISLNSNKDWEPYTGGKPSPSPDYPQEITNLNKAELAVAGINICPDAELLGEVTYYSGIPTNKYGVQAKFPYVQQSETNGIGAVLNTIKGVTYSIAYLGKAHTAVVGIAEYSRLEDVGDIAKAVSYEKVGSLKKVSLTATVDGVMVFILASQWTGEKTNLNTFNKEDMIISVGEPCGTYTPHQSNSTPIDLKGNELLSIPNGVKDEVVIDAEGNVSLIKRVVSVTVDGTNLAIKTVSQTSSGNPRCSTTITNTAIIQNGEAMCDRFTQSTIHNGAARTFYIGNNNTLHFIGDESSPTTVDGWNEWFAANPTTVFYKLTTPQITPLGKVELPALPEATSNVWNDGNIPANVYIQYLKDVNIAYSDLENQIKQITTALSVATLEIATK